MGVSRSLQRLGRDLARVPDTAVRARRTVSQHLGSAPGSAPCSSEDTGLSPPPPSTQRTMCPLSFLPAAVKLQARHVKLKGKAQSQPSVCRNWKQRPSRRQRNQLLTAQSCHGLNVRVPPPQIHMLKPNPKVMILVGVAFGR